MVATSALLALLALFGAATAQHVDDRLETSLVTHFDAKAPIDGHVKGSLLLPEEDSSSDAKFEPSDEAQDLQGKMADCAAIKRYCPQVTQNLKALAKVMKAEKRDHVKNGDLANISLAMEECSRPPGLMVRQFPARPIPFATAPIKPNFVYPVSKSLAASRWSFDGAEEVKLDSKSSIKMLQLTPKKNINWDLLESMMANFEATESSMGIPLPSSYAQTSAALKNNYRLVSIYNHPKHGAFLIAPVRQQEKHPNIDPNKPVVTKMFRITAPPGEDWEAPKKEDEKKEKTACRDGGACVQHGALIRVGALSCSKCCKTAIAHKGWRTTYTCPPNPGTPSKPLTRLDSGEFMGVMGPNDFKGTGWRGGGWAFYAGWQKTGCPTDCTLHSFDPGLTFYVGWSSCLAEDQTLCEGMEKPHVGTFEKVSIDCLALVGFPSNDGGYLAEGGYKGDPKGLDEGKGRESDDYTAKCKAAGLELKMAIMDLKKHANPDAEGGGVTFDDLKRTVDGSVAMMQQYSDEGESLLEPEEGEATKADKAEFESKMTETFVKQFGPYLEEKGIGNAFQFECLANAVGCAAGGVSVGATGGAAVISGALTPCINLVTGIAEHYLDSLNDDRSLDTSDSKFRAQINFYQQLIVRLKSFDTRYGDDKDKDKKGHGAKTGKKPPVVKYDKMTLKAMQQVLCGVQSLNDYYYGSARAVDDKKKEADWIDKNVWPLFMSYGHQLETSMNLEIMKEVIGKGAESADNGKSVKAASSQKGLSPPEQPVVL
jgi:hypothetical protein